MATPPILGPALAGPRLRLVTIVPGHHYLTVEPRLRGSSAPGGSQIAG
jgi:hypothetical protein